MKYAKQHIIICLTICFILILGVESKATTAKVDTDTLNLRKEASTDATILEQLNKGQEVEVIAQEGNWVKIKAKGITGFVHKDYLKIQEDDDIEEQPEDENYEEPTNNDNTENSEQTYINKDTNVYILPLINANKISKISKNTNITVIDEVNGWQYIQTEEVSGWIRNSSVEKEQKETEEITTSTNPIQTPEEEEEEKKEETETKIEEKTMYVSYPSVYVRKGPGTENEIVDSLILNSQVIVIAESGDWYKVKVSGIEGYVAKRLLSNTEVDSTSRNSEERETTQNEQEDNNITETTKGEEIVNYAKKYVGCKYVYGASGPSTFDCSGFTMYVYKNFGINLSHSANAQSKNGTYVSKDELQPGDLVFFKDYETMEGIGHCGIYIGNGNFIHASSGSGYCVKISTLLTGSYNKRYETARRLI